MAILLNLPSTMKEYGPLIYLLEGSNQGEGYLRYTKPRIRDVFSKNWQVNAHVQLLNEVTFNGIINNHVNSKSNKEISMSYREFRENRTNKERKCIVATIMLKILFQSYTKGRRYHV